MTVLTQSNTPKPPFLNKRVSSIEDLFKNRNCNSLLADNEYRIFLDDEEQNMLLAYRITSCYKLPLEVEFQELSNEWKNDTRFHSNPLLVALHPAYRQIIAMGWEAVPLILNDLIDDPSLWFEALGAITGENPISFDHAGDIYLMAEDWLNWGRKNGFFRQ